MKNTLKKDKFSSTILYIMTLVFLVFLLYLFSFLILKDDITEETSEVPVLNKSSLQRIFNDIESRKDIDTEGRPDINKFNFGIDEPFR